MSTAGTQLGLEIEVGGADGGGERGPVYRRIADGIRRAIESHRLRAGARLPSIRSLASELAVNRDTVALAYDALVSDGLLESTVGRGTFVRDTEAESGESSSSSGPVLTDQVERLLGIEDGRTRFGTTDEAVSMHALIPDPAFYPIDDFRRAFNRAVASGGAGLFVYGGAQGYAGLREVLAQRFSAAGIQVRADEIVLCHGASQGIALALRLFASKGDAIAVEAPTYHNVLATLAGLGMRPAVVPMTERGCDLEALEQALSRPEVKAFYTIPTFHNPMGISTPLAHRRALLDVARRCGKPIIEDAFEMDLRVSGRPTPPLAGLDATGLVVHLYSFSKSLFPGLRIGSVTARGRTVDGLVALKQATDLSDSMPLQAGLAEFLDDGAYDRHLGRMRRRLRGRHRAVAAALEAHMPEGTRFTRPDGGYQIWVELPFAIDTRNLLADSVRARVLFSPGSQFLPDGGPSRCLRLSVAQTSEEEIERGLAVLGELVAAHARPSRDARQPASVHL